MSSELQHQLKLSMLRFVLRMRSSYCRSTGCSSAYVLLHSCPHACHSVAYCRRCLVVHSVCLCFSVNLDATLITPVRGPPFRHTAVRCARNGGGIAGTQRLARCRATWEKGRLGDPSAATSRIVPAGGTQRLCKCGCSFPANQARLQVVSDWQSAGSNCQLLSC